MEKHLQINMTTGLSSRMWLVFGFVHKLHVGNPAGAGFAR
jgi:hypothetical protein